MEMPSSSQNGGESSVFDTTGQQSSSSNTLAPSFGPSLQSQRITNYDQSRSYVPKLAISSTHNSINHAKGQHPSTDSQIEFITNLKIRIAVLENDLAHATKDKDEAIKSSVIIARALGNVANSPELATKKLRDPNAEELEELRVEVKRLRRDNAMLWERIESRQAGHMVTYDNSANAASQSNNTYQVPSEQSSYPLASKPRSTHPIITAAINKISVRDESKGSYHPVDFNEETQLPNIVNLERHEDGSLSVPSGFLTRSSNTTKRSINDINNSTLDDVIGSSDDEEPEIKIEDQLLYQERANANFINIPAPAVLKSGFELSPEKARRGDDYANRGYANRDNYYARFNNRNAPTGPRTFEFPPDLSRGTDIWTNSAERDDEINNHMRASDPRDHKFPDYFRYGIQYVPKEGDHDTLRGVLISGLPKDVELRDVLARVRGGRVYSSVLLNTMNISGGNSALVTFINQADAEAYVKYAAAHPIAFGSSDSNEENVDKATVTLIHTPTFPFSPAKLKTIFEFNRTRVLTIRNFPQNISLRRLETDLAARNAFRAESMLEFNIDEEGTLTMEFSNMDAAGSAFGMLSNSQGYRQYRLELQSGRDNCEGGLEELEKAAEKRKPMFPRTESGVSNDRRGGGNGDGDGEMADNSKEVDSVLVTQRRRLAALQKQHDVIPSCRGEGLKSSSWADEVEGESGENTQVEAFNPQTEEIANLENNKVPEDEDKDTLRPQPDQTHWSTESAATLIGPPTESPTKVEDVVAAPVTPNREPRIITGKQWLLELAASKESSTPTSTSIPIPTQPVLTPDTPTSNNATPRPRLALSTTALPPAITSKSPDPSSAEYSIHSFASSAVSAGDDSPQSAVFSKQKVRVQSSDVAVANPTTGTLISSTTPLFSAAGHPVQSSQPSQPIPQPQTTTSTSTSTPTNHALSTFKQTIKNADTNVYFVPGGDTEKAILDSEVSSQRGGNFNVDHHEDSKKILRGVNDALLVDGHEMGGNERKEKGKGREIEGKGNVEENAKMKVEMKMKINPDEIDLGVESDADADADADADGNQGLFQKEMTAQAKAHADTSTSASLGDGPEVVVSEVASHHEEVKEMGEEAGKCDTRSITPQV